MNVAEMEIQARADRDEIRRLNAEVERLRTHLTKTDCANCAEAFERSFNAECDAAKTKAAIELHSDASWYAPVKELLDGLKQIVRERDKARAEVERLRKDLGATRDELRTMSGDCERAEAEIERLSDQREVANGALIARAEEEARAEKAEAEIERLKQDLADIVENDEGQRGEVARLSAEVERLRADLKQAADTNRDLLVGMHSAEHRAGAAEARVRTLEEAQKAWERSGRDALMRTAYLERTLREIAKGISAEKDANSSIYFAGRVVHLADSALREEGEP